MFQAQRPLWESRLQLGLAGALRYRVERIPRTIRPGPCFFPARTKVGGLSTMDMKFGSSAGSAFALRVL
jgi:hypothetical protein